MPPTDWPCSSRPASRTARASTSPSTASGDGRPWAWPAAIRSSTRARERIGSPQQSGPGRQGRPHQPLPELPRRDGSASTRERRQGRLIRRDDLQAAESQLQARLLLPHDRPRPRRPQSERLRIPQVRQPRTRGRELHHLPPHRQTRQDQGHGVRLVRHRILPDEEHHRPLRTRPGRRAQSPVSKRWPSSR